MFSIDTIISYGIKYIQINRRALIDNNKNYNISEFLPDSHSYFNPCTIYTELITGVLLLTFLLYKWNS